MLWTEFRMFDQAGYKREWNARHKDKLREYSRKYQHALRRRDLRYRMLINARWSAKRRGLPFDLVREDICIPSVCPVLGIELRVGEGKMHPGSPSLDRIIPALGYVRGNIQVISYMANVMKHNASPTQLRAFARWIISTFPGD